MTIAEIEKKRINRFRILYELYKSSTTSKVKIYDTAYALGIRNGIYEGCFNYLAHEGLIKPDGKTMATITHAGIKSVEWALLNPDKGSDLFAPFNELDLPK